MFKSNKRSKKPVKWRKIKKLKIRGAYFLLVSNKCTNFQKTHALTSLKMHGQNHGHWHTDRLKPLYPPKYACRGYKNVKKLQMFCLSDVFGPSQEIILCLLEMELPTYRWMADTFELCLAFTCTITIK